VSKKRAIDIVARLTLEKPLLGILSIQKTDLSSTPSISISLLLQDVSKDVLGLVVKALVVLVVVEALVVVLDPSSLPLTIVSESDVIVDEIT
jgi:flagellar assembly factor FliW